MRRPLLLGLRFAVHARPSRSMLIVLGTTLGTALLLTVLGLYEGARSGAGAPTIEEQRVLLTVAVAVACPVVILVLTAARLSAASRERRSAALSRLGLSRRQVRATAGAENAALAGVGATVGVVAHLVLGPAAAGALIGPMIQSGGLPARASVVGTCATVVGVIAAAGVAAYLPHRGGRPGARVDAVSARPRSRRVLPLALGVTVLLIGVVRRSGNNDLSSDELAMFVTGAILAVVGLPLALPVAVRLVGDLAARSSSPAVMVAGRGLQAEPAATTRLVSAVLVALVIVTAALSVVQAFWDQPESRRAVAAGTVGPQYGMAMSMGQTPSQMQAEQLTLVPGVRGAVARLEAMVEGEPGDCGRSDGAGNCSTAFVGTCAELESLYAGSTGCRDDSVLTITQGMAAPRWWTDDAQLWLRAATAEPVVDPAKSAIQLPPVAGVIELTIDPADPLKYSGLDPLFVPKRLVSGLALPVGFVQLTLDGGPNGRDPAEAEAQRIGLSLYADDGQLVRELEAYEAATWTLGSVVVAIGLAGLALAAVDRVMERRRRLSSLQAMGVPRSLIRRSQMIQQLVPLTLGAPIATAIGALAGTAYLSLDDVTGRFPLSQTLALTTVTIAAATMIAVVSQLGLASSAGVSTLRQE